MSKDTSLLIERLEERLNAYNAEVEALTRKIYKHKKGEIQMSPEKEKTKLENRIKRLNAINQTYVPATVQAIARTIQGFSFEAPTASLSQGRDQ